eukprot:TRINITY_DN358_c0_g3_i2.p1 TRINITY_DN358_c0_g3~~TRINITY_DN358_c0_g3_i2.p1  ORF type:complete len:207 (+),score=-12.95 TRINITY_DN358_c0_g3_i2:153-773(+)
MNYQKFQTLHINGIKLFLVESYHKQIAISLQILQKSGQFSYWLFTNIKIKNTLYLIILVSCQISNKFIRTTSNNCFKYSTVVYQLSIFRLTAENCLLFNQKYTKISQLRDKYILKILLLQHSQAIKFPIQNKNYGFYISVSNSFYYNIAKKPIQILEKNFRTKNYSNLSAQYKSLKKHNNKIKHITQSPKMLTLNYIKKQNFLKNK